MYFVKENLSCRLFTLSGQLSTTPVANGTTQYNFRWIQYNYLGIYEEEGLAGLINICKFFLDKISEHFTKGMDEYETKGIA